MYAKVYGATICGIDGRIVTVEIDISQGLPAFDIVGLPNQSVKEARERVRAAVKNSGYEFPMRRIVVNLAPADIRKVGAGLDMAIAVGIIAASGQIKMSKKDLSRCLTSSLFIGELSLDGNIKSIRGMLSMAIAAKESDIMTIYTGMDNAASVKAVPHLLCYGGHTLEKIVNMMEHPELSAVCSDNNTACCDQEKNLDYGDVEGQEVGKRAMMLSAAGFHHIMMTGPPGAGKTMLAERLPSILPSMTDTERMEISRIHDVAGLLKDGALLRNRPFRHPHHTATLASMAGGGASVKPGEITLAHHGILFLDEAPEFRREVLDSLRQPLESHRITISRSHGTYEYPARFICVVAANPCPCGYYGDKEKECVCSTTEIMRYAHRLSGPVKDRMDIAIAIERPTFAQMRGTGCKNLTSAAMFAQVQEARKKQELRFKECSFSSNGMMPHNAIRELALVKDSAWHMLGELFDRFHLSGRAFDRILRVSRTIADLEGADHVEENHIAEAMLYRQTI